MPEYTITIYPDLDKPLLAFIIVYGTEGEDWVRHLFTDFKSWRWN